MTENYNPSRKEVAFEVMKDIGNDLKETGMNVAEVASLFALGPYVCPTVRRFFSEGDAKIEINKLNFTHCIGYTVGCIAGFALDFAQALGYVYAVRNNHSEVLLLPIATNVASLLYEKSKKAREKLFLNRNVKTLDKLVE